MSSARAFHFALSASIVFTVAFSPTRLSAASCPSGESQGSVQTPVFVTNLNGQTSWYASPVVYDLDGDGSNELIAAYYNVYVFSSEGALLDIADDGSGRVYTPHVVADLEGDGTTEVVVGRGHEVFAFEWNGSELAVKSGWPADTTTGGSAPEIRGMAAADLDDDGSIEIVVTTTQTVPSAQGGAQVFVFSADGSSYQPIDGHDPAWPRYNALTGLGNDADRNGPGHNGYGCYGLNVGIGDIDDDPELEILATYDNHHIQAFDHDGVAIDASGYYTNRQSDYKGNPLTWGQFIRWADPQVEEDHYHLHSGDWPHPDWTEWLQWTASPPGVADLDGDGKNEVIGIPNIELHVPYETQAYAIMVLEGAHGDQSRSARRKAGWETLPRGDFPMQVDGWYPPYGVPAPTLVDISGDERPEIVVSLNDGYLYAYSPTGQRLWRTSYRHGKSIMFSSEATVADLNQDGVPEILLATYGDPDVHDSGYLMILSNEGEVLYDIALPKPGHNGNGNGAPAAPSVGDLDGDGELEVFVQTFDHGMDVFTVPGSGTDCMLWPTARGGALRMGRQEIAVAPPPPGIDRIGVFRPADQRFYLDVNGDGVLDGGDIVTSPFGPSSQSPVAGDWDGDGADDIGAKRWSRWRLDSNGDRVFDPDEDQTFKFGAFTAAPVVGDWNGDGSDEIGAKRGKRWYLDLNGDGVYDDAVDLGFKFGGRTDVPVAGDWDGDGTDGVGVWSVGEWRLDMDGDQVWDPESDRLLTFGDPMGIPVTGDWNGDGIDAVGVVVDNEWLLDLNNNGAWDGTPTDARYTFGEIGDLPVVGNW